MAKVRSIRERCLQEAKSEGFLLTLGIKPYRLKDKGKDSA